MSVRVQPRGGAVSTLDMRGVAVRVNDGSARIPLVPVLLQRYGRGGDLPGAGGTAEGRWIDFTSGAQFPDPCLTTSGTASVSGGAFGGACPGVADTEEFTCTTGRQAVLADVTVERSSQLVDIDWDAVVLPAFRIVGSVFDP